MHSQAQLKVPSRLSILPYPLQGGDDKVWEDIRTPHSASLPVTLRTERTRCWGTSELKRLRLRGLTITSVKSLPWALMNYNCGGITLVGWMLISKKAFCSWDGWSCTSTPCIGYSFKTVYNRWLNNVLSKVAAHPQCVWQVCTMPEAGLWSEQHAGFQPSFPRWL